MSEAAVVFDNRHDFLSALETVPTAYWSVQPGVALWFTSVSVQQPVLILTLAPALHYPGLRRHILQRRFLEAEALSLCGISLDEQQNLRLRRTLSTLSDAVVAIEELWRLAGLPPR